MKFSLAITTCILAFTNKSAQAAAVAGAVGGTVTGTPAAGRAIRPVKQRSLPDADDQHPAVRDPSIDDMSTRTKRGVVASVATTFRDSPALGAIAALATTFGLGGSAVALDRHLRGKRSLPDADEDELISRYLDDADDYRLAARGLPPWTGRGYRPDLSDNYVEPRSS